MAELLEFNTISDERGDLIVVEKLLPFEVKRFYYIFNVKGDDVRGGHRHKKTIQALICLGGKCRVFVDNGKSKINYELDNPNKCLLLAPEDWHTMDQFSENATLLVMASEYYDRDDYINDRI